MPIVTSAASAENHNDHFVVRNGVRCAGAHLIIDLYNAERLDDIDHIDATLRRCVDAAGATLLHIHLHHFEPNGGVSGVAVLAESHISIHSWPENGYAALDVFMCGDAKPEACVPVLREAFKPEACRRSASCCAVKEPERRADKVRSYDIKRPGPFRPFSFGHAADINAPQDDRRPTARERGSNGREALDSETLFDDLGFRMTYAVDKVLYEQQTDHQHLILFEHRISARC